MRSPDSKLTWAFSLVQLSLNLQEYEIFTQTENSCDFEAIATF